MLVLSRRTNEVIHIGDNIKLYVVSINGGVVKLGIDAPREVTIYRDEVRRRLNAQLIDAPPGSGAHVPTMVDDQLRGLSAPGDESTSL